MIESSTLFQSITSENLITVLTFILKVLKSKIVIIPNRTYNSIILGGPCGGKTTAQNRLATFFESLGWRVFRVPETATILLNGGVRTFIYVYKEKFSILDNIRSVSAS